MSKIKITIVLTLLVLCGTIPLSAYETDPEDWTYIAYPIWRTFTHKEKVIYLTGFLQGTLTFTIQVELQFNSKALSQQLKNYLPVYSNEETVKAIDWIYEMPKWQDIPVYLIIPNIDKLMNDRYQYYLQYEKGGQ